MVLELELSLKIFACEGYNSLLGAHDQNVVIKWGEVKHKISEQGKNKAV